MVDLLVNVHLVSSIKHPKTFVKTLMNVHEAIDVPGTLTVTTLLIIMCADVKVVLKVMAGCVQASATHAVAPPDRSVSYGMMRQDVDAILVTFLTEILAFPTNKWPQQVVL